MAKFSCASDSQDSLANSEYEVAQQLQEVSQQLEEKYFQDFAQQHRAGAQLPEPHLWGYLQHCTGSLTRVDMWKISPEYYFGRDEDNTIVLNGMTISSQHCAIVWNGKEDHTSSVVVHDNSSNGTYINGKKIGKGKSCILRDGNEIAFGTCIRQEHDVQHDYRFIFRHIADGRAPEGYREFYDVSHEIGRGAYGRVMKAICRKTGVWCAIKVMNDRPTFPEKSTRKDKAKQMDAENAYKRRDLAREVAILAKLKHPNICQLREIFFSGSNGMEMVLEYIDGGNLLSYIDENKILYESDAQHITHQICSALDHVHRMGIAHRDLKPENILLTSDTPPVVKIADFGLAKAVDNATMLRTQCGTPDYMAPEVVDLKKATAGYDHLADSWSVGVIVFNMFTKCSPFESGTDRSKPERVVLWFLLKESNLSEEAHDFVRYLLENDPEERMSMGDALRHAWLNKTKERARKLSFDEEQNPGTSRPKKQARKN